MLMGYRTFSAPNPDDSFAVIRIDDKLRKRRHRASGLELEAAALISLVGTSSSCSETKNIEISKELKAALEAFACGDPVVNGSKVFHALDRFLKTRPVTLLERTSDPELEKFLEQMVTLHLEEPKPKWELSPEDAKWVEDNNATVVYADGSGDNSMLLASWAWYVNDELYDSAIIEHAASSHTGERYAIAEAIKSLPGALLIVSDHTFSKFSKDLFCQHSGVEDPVKKEFMESSHIRIVHVKGHSNCPGNIAVDRLASDTFKARVSAILNDAALNAECNSRAVAVRESISKERTARRVRDEIISKRRSEILDEQHPNWRSLDRKRRKSLFVKITNLLIEETPLMVA